MNIQIIRWQIYLDMFLDRSIYTLLCIYSFIILILYTSSSMESFIYLHHISTYRSLGVVVYAQCKEGDDTLMSDLFK